MQLHLINFPPCMKDAISSKIIHLSLKHSDVEVMGSYSVRCRAFLFFVLFPLYFKNRKSYIRLTLYLRW